MSCAVQTALPHHWIRFKSSGLFFLDRMERMLKDYSSIKAKRYKRSETEMLLISLGNSKHFRDLQIDLSVEARNRRLIMIDARADWKQDPPCPDLYDKVVTDFVTPYLDIHNRQHRTDIRLEKGKLYTGRLDLPSEASRIFKSFVALSLRKYKPPDWNYLYRFIHHCHAHKIKLSSSEMIHFLQEAGFAEEAAKQIARIYAHGRNILSFEKRPRNSLNVYFD